MARRNTQREEVNALKFKEAAERSYNSSDVSNQLKNINKVTTLTDSQRRKIQFDSNKYYANELGKDASANITSSEKLTGMLYDNTPSSNKAKRKDVLALSNSKYTNTLLEKILQTQNDSAFTDASLKYQQQVMSTLSVMQADIKQLVEYMKPKEGPQTQAERKELEMSVSDMAKAMATLDFRGLMKEFGIGVAKQFDSDGTGELLMSMLGMFKEQIQEGSFGSTIKDMIKEAILDKMPYGNEIRKFKEDPVGFSQLILNQLGLSENAGIRSLFRQNIKGMKPDLTPQIKKIDMSAAATFDNKVYTSITRVIPEQLYKMVALLSGREERKFDWEHQTYRNVSNMMAEELQRNASKNVTYHVDSFMRDLGSNIEDVAAMNNDVKNMLKIGADGKVVKDGTTKLPELKNRWAVRKVLENIVTSGATLTDLIRGDAIQVIRQYKLNKGFTETNYGECIDAVKFLQVYYRSISKEDRESAIADMEAAKKDLHGQEISELMQGLYEDERVFYESILSSRKFSAKDMKNLFRNIHIGGARVNMGGGGSRAGARFANAARNNPDMVESLKAMMTANASRTLSDKERDELNKFLSDLASGSGIDKISRAKDLHDGTNDVKNKLSEQREQFDYLMRYMDDQTIETMNNTNSLGRDAKGVNLAAIKSRLDNGNTITAEQEKYFQKELTRLRRAMDLYQAYDNAGLTANATARLLGVNPSSVKNKLRGPEDLMAFITDDGKIDQTKLTAFMDRSGVRLSYVNDETNERLTKEYQASQRGTIGGGLKSSITKTLSAIFGDPKIANKAGIAVGSAAGLGIAELLKDAGLISSPKAQYLLAAVGGGLMSMERTRRYMQTVFGPEGDIKNDQGYTNKEIFFAKAMQKYLPIAGAGAATFKYVNKAFNAFGPIGKVVGLPLAVMTSIGVGAMTPSIMKWAQRSLFDRDKDDQSWAAKFGRFLKDVPFVKKYFDLTGVQSPGQIKLRTLDMVRSRLQQEAQANPDKADAINAKIKELDKVYADIQSKVNDGLDSDTDHMTEMDKSITQLMESIDSEFGNLGLSQARKDDEARRVHANALKEAERNSGESPVDMSYTNHYTGNSGALKVGIDKLKDFKESASGDSVTVEQLYNLISEGKPGLYDLLLDDAQRESSPTRRDTQAFLEKFELYKRLRDAGIDLSDSAETGVSLEEYLKAGLEEFIEKNKDARDMLNAVATDDEETAQIIIGDEEKVKKLLAISKLSNPEIRATAFAEWKAGLTSEQLNKLGELSQDDAGKDAIIQKLFDITRSYVELENLGRSDVSKLTAAEMERRAMNIMARSYNVDMLTKALSNKMADKAGTIATKIKNLIEPGNEQEDIKKHEDLINAYNMLNGGKGSKSNTRVSMKELSDKRFRTGESLSVAGCSVTALNNALFYLGITTVDIDTLIEIANKHLTTDGGVNSEFFNEVSKNLGLKTTIYNNIDNTFTPDSIQEVKPTSTRGVIALLKNKDGNGNHYVTIRKIGLKSCEVDDPELNSSNTKMTTGDICVRLVELVVLDKSKENASLKKTKIQERVDSIKNLFNKGKALLGDVKSGNIFDTVKKSAKEMWNSRVVNPIMETIGQPFNTVKESASDIVNAILNGLKDITLSTRIVEDYTLPLKINDAEAARAVANAQGMEAGSSNAAAKKANAATKKLLKNRDVLNEMYEADAAQDALASLRSLQNDGMVAGGSTGAGGRGSQTRDAAGNVVPENQGQPGWFGNILGGLLGGKLTKPGTWGKLGGAAALAATAMLGWKYLGKKAAGASLDQLKKFRHNMPIFGDRDEVDYVYDENGHAIQGQHKDTVGSFRNLRDASNTAKAAALSVSYGFKAVKHVSKVANQGGKIAKAAGSMIKMADQWNIPGLVMKAMSWASKVFDTLTKWGFGELGFGSRFLDKIFKSFFTKHLPKISKLVGKSGILKKLPIVGAVIGTAQAVWSFIDCIRHPEAYSDVDPEKLTTAEKYKLAFAKAFFDAGIEAILSFWPPLAIAFSVARGMKIITFNDIKTLFGVDYNTLRSRVAERSKDDVEKDISPETLEKREAEFAKMKKQVGEGAADAAMSKKYGDKWRTQENDPAVTSDGAGKVTASDAVNKYNSQSKVAQDIQNKALSKFNEELDPETLKKVAIEAETNPEYQIWSKRGSGYTHPLKNRGAVVTSAYGYRNVVGGSKNHKGIDLRGDENTAVFAVKDGEVIQSTQRQGEVKIKHDDGTVTRYLHLSQRFFKVGDRVKAGEKIGMVGGIGVSGYPQFNPHLHFETFDKDGQYRDPFIQLGLDPGVFKLGPGGKENERYLSQHAWMLSKSKEEAAKLAKAQQLDTNKGKQPEKLGLHNEKGGERDKKTAADYATIDKPSDNRMDDIVQTLTPIISMANNNTQAIQMLSAKMDQMIQLLTQIASSTGQISNNSMFDFNAPAVIR